jgi:hypothetical protein
VTTPFAIDTDVVDGAGGFVVVVVVVDDDVGDVAVIPGGDVVLVRVPLSVAGLESEHAAPSTIAAATSATTHRKSVSGHSRG